MLTTYTIWVKGPSDNDFTKTHEFGGALGALSVDYASNAVALKAMEDNGAGTEVEVRLGTTVINEFKRVA